MAETRTITTLGGAEVTVVLGAPVAGRRRRDAHSDLSADAARTQRNNDSIRRGVHPATGRALLDPLPTVREACGGCAHHHAYERYSSRKKTFHKCDVHRLGQSHSAASDIRVSWPACALFEPLVEGGS